MKIISLLPSATEIVCALGLASDLVAVTHECDYPAYVTEKPFITRSLLRPDLTSGEIDAAVRSQLSADAHSLYAIDRALLATLAPDLIITQKLCEVCAVAYDEVLDAVGSLPHQPGVLNLEPMTLSEVLADIQRVADAAGHPDGGRQLVATLHARIERVRETVAHATTQPRVAFLEWIDPLFCGGHWNPELVRLAGGIDPLGRERQPSVRIEWEQIAAFAPEVMVISCCGFSEERTRQDLPLLAALPGYAELPCVRAGRVHIVNGSAYFSRPGPRLVDSLEMLASLLHPDLFPLIK
ncbi:MAG: ABC transporter, substrate-binding protein (cluster 8, B12/iron complex) [Ktedonobacterales bacterium]|jgi:iron complex transport system substrate-binding protein|nr:MAG: ABC transporter, substrate-binding protein (cluster 8, B12/iron complex) [Ktedonobacterales bacterium]